MFLSLQVAPTPVMIASTASVSGWVMLTMPPGASTRTQSPAVQLIPSRPKLDALAAGKFKLHGMVARLIDCMYKLQQAKLLNVSWRRCTRDS
jgi:hypothetical protein